MYDELWKMFDVFFLDEKGWIKVDVIKSFFPQMQQLVIEGNQEDLTFDEIFKDLMETTAKNIRIWIKLKGKVDNIRLDNLKSKAGQYLSALKHAGWKVICARGKEHNDYNLIISTTTFNVQIAAGPNGYTNERV